MYSLITATRAIIRSNCRSGKACLKSVIQNLENVKVTKRKTAFSPLFLILANDLPRFLKEHSVPVVKNCIEQVEFVAAYRIRRGLQIFNLYSRLNDVSFKILLQTLKKFWLKRTRDFFIASVGIKFNWESERISKKELYSHANDIVLCKFLRNEIEDEVEDSCECGQNKDVYIRFPDVTAIDFLTVFLDIDNRKHWDSHAVKLELIESEPSTNSDIIYWETKWPTPYSNRDYVYKRRYLIDEELKVMVVKNRTTDHPDSPKLNSKARVTDYWSYAVIKPETEFNEPGIEFSLTYFDNPGATLPSTITQWVTLTGMPDYLNRLGLEARNLANERKLREEEELKLKAEQERIEEEKRKKDEPPPPPPEGPCDSSNPMFYWVSFFEKNEDTLW